MHYVYLIRSLQHVAQTYVGTTSDLKNRIKEHNSGRSPHTAKYKPWEIVVYLGFKDTLHAVNFERFLKSGTGRSFIARRLLQIKE